MFGLLQLFGRSSAQKALDHALREAGLHPLVVPEAVKITVLRLIKEEMSAGAASREAAHAEAAELLAYCMLGRDQFIASNSVHEADRADLRVEHALIAGDSLDARLILLALHARLIAPSIAERVEIENG
jgi:hypothetical protein